MTLPDCRAYKCRVCNEDAINEVGEPWTEARECRYCYSVPDLDRAPAPSPDDSNGPDASDDSFSAGGIGDD